MSNRPPMNPVPAKKAAVIACLVLAVILFFLFDLERYLSLEFFKESQARFGQLYAQHPLRIISIYMLIYIAVTTLSLPGAVVMTLAGGALFGLAVGTITVSFASTIGATLACLASRFILRDWVQGRFGEKLKTIDDGFEKEGSFYLFSLRLIPIFPFFLINLLMGLTRMPITSYFWVSQLGMLPATIVYVNAGSELARIDSLAGIVSPRLLISFVILGLFPITVKKLLSRLRRDRAGTGEKT